MYFGVSLPGYFLEHALLAGGDGIQPGEPVIDRALTDAHAVGNLRAWEFALFDSDGEFLWSHHNEEILRLRRDMSSKKLRKPKEKNMRKKRKK